MRRAWRALLLGLALWLALGPGATLAEAPAGQAPDAPPDAQAADRQILVLLRLPPAHYRPGGAYGDAYDDSLGRGARRRLAQGLARAHGLRLVTDWPMPLLGVDCYVMAAPAGQDIQAEIVRLSGDPAVAWSQPMHLYEGRAARAAAPNDPLYAAQPAASLWRLADLHQMATGRGVLVALFDSQVQRDHPDLAGQVRISQSFVGGPPVAGEAHGTGVAGVIAARANNGVGIAGVAPDASLMALRACWQTGPEAAATVCDSLTLAEALHFAVLHGARVINLSLGGPPDALLGRLVDVALTRGIVVVAAYDRALPGGGFPASHPGVVAVADAPVAGAADGLYTAPGRDIPTTQPGGRWALVNGSSFAAAHVSGLIALTLGAGGPAGASPRERTPRLVAARSGGGAIDTCATLLRAQGPCDCACARPEGSIALAAP
jgi:hypothetical protein